MKQKILKQIVAAFAFVILAFHTAPVVQVHAKANNDIEWVDFRIPEKINKPDKSNRTVSDVLLCVGQRGSLELEDAVGKMRWTVSNRRILKIVSKSGSKCSIKPMQSGTVTVTAAAQNKSMKYIVTIKAGDEYAKAWCKQWAEDYISDDMDFKTKLLTASEYLCGNGFEYGRNTHAADVITEKKGTCMGGADLLQNMCTAMGFKAEMRFAADDDMSRYPSGTLFGSMHYNVVVDVDGEKYYIDGTPGNRFVYLSSTDKLLFAGWIEDDEDDD